MNGSAASAATVVSAGSCSAFRCLLSRIASGASVNDGDQCLELIFYCR
jgi:hypothetical protein